MAHGDAVYEEMTTTHSINVLSALSPHASNVQQSVSPSQLHRCGYPAVQFSKALPLSRSVSPPTKETGTLEGVVPIVYCLLTF